MFEALASQPAEIDRSRLAAVVILSDGQVHDVPASLGRLGFHAPVHVLLTGAPMSRTAAWWSRCRATAWSTSRRR